EKVIAVAVLARPSQGRPKFRPENREVQGAQERGPQGRRHEEGRVKEIQQPPAGSEPVGEGETQSAPRREGPGETRGCLEPPAPALLGEIKGDAQADLVEITKGTPFPIQPVVHGLKIDEPTPAEPQGQQDKKELDQVPG